MTTGERELQEAIAKVRRYIDDRSLWVDTDAIRLVCDAAAIAAQPANGPQGWATPCRVPAARPAPPLIVEEPLGADFERVLADNLDTLIKRVPAAQPERPPDLWISHDPRIAAHFTASLDEKVGAVRYVPCAKWPNRCICWSLRHCVDAAAQPEPLNVTLTAKDGRTIDVFPRAAQPVVRGNRTTEIAAAVSAAVDALADADEIDCPTCGLGHCGPSGRELKVKLAAQPERARDTAPPAITFTLREARQLVGAFGGDDTEMIVRKLSAGAVVDGASEIGVEPSPAGLWAHFADYPEEGCLYLGPQAVNDAAPVALPDGDTR